MTPLDDSARGSGHLEVSIVMPCLNEARTVGDCVRRAREALDRMGLAGEVVVADNGSHDHSVAIAAELGARVIHASDRGYGAALKAGIESACGRYVVMGDADGSYDFADIGPFVERLRGGHDVVFGNRFRGEIADGAMPWANRFIGNPLLSWLGRRLFETQVADFHCGLRAFSREAYARMGLRSSGMEFASEMVARSSLLGLRVTEVPIRLHKDGRLGRSHLRPVRDGLRHVGLMLRLGFPRFF